MENIYQLKFNDRVINKDFKLPAPPADDWELITTPTYTTLSTEVLRYFISLDFIPSQSTLLFSGKAGKYAAPHTDVSESSFGFNYILNCPVSYMCWYRVVNLNVTLGGMGSKEYYSHEMEDLKRIEIKRLREGTLYLVRTDIPHAVSNTSDTDRYCISIRGRPNMVWGDAVRFFQKEFATGPGTINYKV